MPGPNYPHTQLSHHQVLQHVFDEAQDRLRVEATYASEGGDPVGTTDTDDGVGLNVYLLNQSLEGGIKTTRYTITDVATKLVPDVDKLTNAKVVGFRIIGSEPVYIGTSSVTSSTGYPKYEFEEMTMDIKGFDVYIVCAAGKTCNIAVIQIA